MLKYHPYGLHFGSRFLVLVLVLWNFGNYFHLEVLKLEVEA